MFYITYIHHEMITTSLGSLYHCISEKAMASHSSTLAWKIPWMEDPGRLQSMGSWRVGHDRATSLSLFTFMHWKRKWQPTPVFLPGESQGQWAPVYGVAQSRTRLKWLSSRLAGVTKVLSPKQLMIRTIESQNPSAWVVFQIMWVSSQGKS